MPTVPEDADAEKAALKAQVDELHVETEKMRAAFEAMTAQLDTMNAVNAAIAEAYGAVEHEDRLAFKLQMTR